MALSHLGDANDGDSDVSTELTLFHDHLFSAHKKRKIQHTASTKPKPIEPESGAISSDGELVDLELSLAPACSYKIIRLFGVNHRVKADQTNGSNQQEEKAALDHQEQGLALVAVVEDHHQEEPALAVQPLAAIDHQEQGLALVAVVEDHHQEASALAVQPLAAIDHLEQGLALVALVAVVEDHHQEEPALAVQPLAAVVDEPNFTIVKNLENSDVSQLCRLLLRKKLVEAHVLRFLNEEEKAIVNSKEGLRVVIRDIDTGSDHQLKLKQHVSSKSYVVIDNWRREFVKRRDLRWGDSIGMYWHVQERCLCFSVRRRAVFP